MKANPLDRRSAKRTGELWLQRLKESTPHKKLNLVYLANGSNFHKRSVVIPVLYFLTQAGFLEVVQQSKARRKVDFLVAFSPVCTITIDW